TRVQWFQASRGNQIEQPLPAQADGVEGQAERAAGLQLHRPDGECLADQSSSGAVLSADTTGVGPAAMDHPVGSIGYHCLEPALSKQRPGLPRVPGEYGQGDWTFPAVRDHLRVQSFANDLAFASHRVDLEVVLEPLASQVAA